MFPSSSTNTKNISIKCVNPASANTKNQSSTNDMKDQWEGILRRYDTNGDKLISKKELKEAFKKAGSSMPRWRAFRAMRRADKNGDGFIQESELPEILKYAAEKGYFI